MAAEYVRPEDINFMATHARGLICLTLTPERCKQLELPLMVGNHNSSADSTNFTLSIEGVEGVTTGISAADRAQTIRVAVAKHAVPSDIVQPGHVFPLMSQPGGVLSRAGHTEAGCDLARLAGCEPASAIVEIMNDDGSMARRPELEAFSKKHNIKLGTIADLIHYRSANERTVKSINKRIVNTSCGEFILYTYLNTALNERHFAFVKGDIKPDQPVLTRVHVANTVRDVLALQDGDDSHPHAWDFRSALDYIAKEGAGVLVYICTSETTEEIDDNITRFVEGEKRRGKNDSVYKQTGTGSQILQDLNVKKIRLMGAPLKYKALASFDLEVVEYISND